MKRLIILILFICLPVFGQDCVGDSSLYPYTIITPLGNGNTLREHYTASGTQRSIHTPPMTGGQMTIDWSKEYLVISILDLYDQYKTECYNDSTLVIKSFGAGIYTIYFNTHNQLTLDGFMEFIREKQN